MLNKFQISGALGLSCVEYYFLAWIAQYYSVEKLYAQSFVPIKKVFDDFANGAEYARYDALPRVQDTAERCCIVEHSFMNLTAKQAMKIIPTQGYDDLCLVRVNDRFFENSKRRAWRDDHYICVDKALAWVNEYPLSVGKFAESEFERVYDGAVCCYFLKDLHAEPKDDPTQKLREQDFGGINTDIDLAALVSALGILRVSRKRLELFYKSRERVRALFEEENALLDRLYMETSLKRVRKQQGGNEISRKLNTVIEIEKAIAEALNDK